MLCRRLLRTRTAVLWLVGVAALAIWLAASAVWQQNDLQADFRNEVMAAAVEGRKAGKFRIDITKIVRQQIDPSAPRNEVDLLHELGLDEVKVVRPQQDLLDRFNADTYRVFESIIDRVGIATYWEVNAVVFYRKGKITDMFVSVDYVSL